MQERRYLVKSRNACKISSKVVHQAEPKIRIALKEKSPKVFLGKKLINRLHQPRSVGSLI